MSGVSSPIRVAIVFWFMLVCPGMAFTRLLGIRERLVELTLAIALSIALDTIVAETMALAKHWSPQWGTVILAMLSVVGAVIQLTTMTGDTPARDRQ